MPGRDERDDAAIVAAVIAGDSAAFASIYDRYADRIHDYAFSVLRQSSDAADVMQDTFLAASQRLGQLRDPSRLRPWLYAIARSHALAIIRKRQRTVVSDDVDEVVEMIDTDGSREAVDLVWAAAAGLEASDRDVLDLHLRQGLDGQDLAEALGVTSNAANVALHRVRERLEQAVGAVLLARTSRGECAELDVMVAGGLSPLVRKRVARHVDSCAICGERRRHATSASALFSMSGLVAAPLALRKTVLDRVGTDAAAQVAQRLEWNADGFPVSDPVEPMVGRNMARVARQPADDPRPMMIAASAIVLVVALTALFMFFRRSDDQFVSSAPSGTVAALDVDALPDSAPPDSAADRVASVPTTLPTASTSAPTNAVPTTAAAPVITAPVSSATTVAPRSTVSPTAPPTAPTTTTAGPPTITVVDYQCASTIVIVVDLTGVAPLSADLRFVEGGDAVPFSRNRSGVNRFSVSFPLGGDASVTPQVVAKSGAGSTTQQLDTCIVIG